MQIVQSSWSSHATLAMCCAVHARSMAIGKLWCQRLRKKAARSGRSLGRNARRAEAKTACSVEPQRNVSTSQVNLGQKPSTDRDECLTPDGPDTVNPSLGALGNHGASHIFINTINNLPILSAKRHGAHRIWPGLPQACVGRKAGCDMPPRTDTQCKKRMMRKTTSNS